MAAQVGSGLALLPLVPGRAEAATFVNDIHSQLNRTLVERVVRVDSEAAVRSAIGQARKEGRGISIAGGRHAMGGQQFARNSVLLDTRAMQKIVSLDRAKGIVEVEAGIQWPQLIQGLIDMQAGDAKPWGIVQKQTGADRLTVGGALGANIHGRGLTLKPIVEQVESFSLMDSAGRTLECSRTENSELYRLVIGGYGLFGVVTRVRLRLMPRTKLERNVQIINADELMSAFEARIKEGYLYGDCQFSTDTQSETFLRTGVFSCYRPLPADAEMPSSEKELGEGNWRDLYLLSHADTKRAYDAYTSYYLSTSGQRYWSDTNQLSVYIDDYHEELDRQLGAKHKGSEMITELYVPRPALPAFLDSVRADFRQHGVQVIYGTIRLIERDNESFLAWAREPWVCTVMNLHVEHSREGLRKAERDFRRLIDRAIEQGGSYFLTYHRWATRHQVEKCYPQMAKFLKLKRKYDPSEVFQSDWYRHCKRMFAGRG
ncbi:MAG TPA: FAD-binding oxidoreductase [Phycisphaerae bacterium]|nr:FAD-binding oxidoreductase [Phycisphaerae bacterium]